MKIIVYWGLHLALRDLVEFWEFGGVGFGDLGCRVLWLRV